MRFHIFVSLYSENLNCKNSFFIMYESESRLLIMYESDSMLEKLFSNSS